MSTGDPKSRDGEDDQSADGQQRRCARSHDEHDDGGDAGDRDQRKGVEHAIDGSGKQQSENNSQHDRHQYYLQI